MKNNTKSVVLIGNLAIPKSVEWVLLFLFGALAILAHSKLRIPLRIPGHHGLEFMLLMLIGRGLSEEKFASSIFSLGVASLIFIPGLGFKDPFMTMVYILPGIAMDFFYLTLVKSIRKDWVLALASGFSYALIPIFRVLISSLTGFIYPSLMGGIFYPIILHFIFGSVGGFLGYKISHSIKS